MPDFIPSKDAAYFGVSTELLDAYHGRANFVWPDIRNRHHAGGICVELSVGLAGGDRAEHPWKRHGAGEEHRQGRRGGVLPAAGPGDPGHADGDRNQQRHDLGLTVRDVEPTPVPAPAMAPQVLVVSITGNTVRISDDRSGESETGAGVRLAWPGCRCSATWARPHLRPRRAGCLKGTPRRRART